MRFMVLFAADERHDGDHRRGARISESSSRSLIGSGRKNANAQLTAR
jgi:hypothetical protein